MKRPPGNIRFKLIILRMNLYAAWLNVQTHFILFGKWVAAIVLNFFDPHDPDEE